MATWIVTGGAGFIGSTFVRLALLRGQRVVVLDWLTYAGHRESLAEVANHEAFELVVGDIADRETVRSLVERLRPDAIVNFAAESHVDRSIDGPGEFVRTNVHGTFELLEASRALLAGAPELASSFRFLHVSTDEVYGSLGPTGLFTEETPYAPNSPYSATKAAADHLVRAWHETYGLPTILTNCSNNYGPRQFPEKLIPVMILNALEGRPLPIYGDGANVRDWIHVEDHCLGVLAALERGAPGGKYNLGGEAERTNLEVVAAICAALEAQRPAQASAHLAAVGATRYLDLRRFVADRPGHDRRYAIDTSKSRRELGWSPTRSFEVGIDETVAWYLANREWCDAVQSKGYQRERLGLAGGGAR